LAVGLRRGARGPLNRKPSTWRAESWGWGVQGCWDPHFRNSDYPSLGAGDHWAASVRKPSSMFTRRMWPGPGGSNLSLGVQRSGGCGYERRVWGVRRILDVEPQWSTAFNHWIIESVEKGRLHNKHKYYVNFQY